MVEKVKNRILIVMNYEEYPREIADKIAVLLIQEGYRLVGSDLINSKQERKFYFSKRD